jgi:hypothetical protein
MVDTKKYIITIKRVQIEEYEMTLENKSIMAAFDEARCLAANRSKNKSSQFFVTKIEVKE